MKIAWQALAVASVAAGIAGCASTPEGSVGGNDTAVDISRRTDDSDARRRARIRLELAVNYYQERSYKVALDELRLALAADPNFADVHGVLALVYMDLGERALAEQSFERALHLSPQDSYINTNYGWFLCQTGREAKSIPYFITATRNSLYPTPGLPLQNAGVCAMRIGDHKSAEEYLLRSFQADPASPVTMFNLGRLYYIKADYTRAKYYVQRLLGRVQPTAEALWLMLRIDRKLEDRASVAALATQLRSRFPESPEFAKLRNGAFDE